MGRLADSVVNGNPIPPAGLTFTFDVHADPVCVIERSKPTNPPLYAFYLGEADGWVALYDPVARRTIREDRADLRISSIPAVLWDGRAAACATAT
jgi:hypothetical protein